MVRYCEAIEWMAAQADVEEYWVGGHNTPIPQTVELTCHLFGKTTEQVKKDLEKEIWEQDNLDRGNG